MENFAIITTLQSLLNVEKILINDQIRQWCETYESQVTHIYSGSAIQTWAETGTCQDLWGYLKKNLLKAGKDRSVLEHFAELAREEGT